MSLLIVGCGYVGMRVAQLYRTRGESVWALTRSPDRAEALERVGINAVVGHWLNSNLASCSKFSLVTQILVSVPHREDLGQGSLTHCRGLENLVRNMARGWRRLVYLSTTGVYGETQSEIVDEDSQTDPPRIGGRIAIEAEKWLNENCGEKSCVTLRLSGIYGPERIPHVAAIRAGEPLAVPRDGFLNLIHVEDVVLAISQVFSNEMKRNCYVLSDGNPVRRDDFYREIAKLCGVSDPQFSQADPNVPRTLRAATSKRICPARLFDELSFRPQFPSFREGLVSCMA